MARQRKKKAKNKRVQKAAPQNLQVLAENQLATGKFSEAIKTFRQLLKNDGDERWMDSLAKAYLGRIKQLSAKGMSKEALVIYTNMVNSCSAEDPLLHIKLLLNNDHTQQALEIFTRLQKLLSKKERLVIEELFAALLLSGTGQDHNFLPEDSQLKRHYRFADLALQAYCRQDYAAADSQLQNISFRSPYRNFRLALKGMLTFAENRQEADIFFAKIAADSPFFYWVTPYRQVNDSDNPVVKLSSTEKQVAQRLEGIDQSTRIFIDGIRSRRNNPLKLYSFLVGKGRFLGRDKLRDICFRLLPHAPDKIPDFQRRYGPLSEYDSYKLMALAGEVEHAYWHAANDWQELHKIVEAKKDPEDNFTIALLYRHCAKLLNRDPDGYSGDRIELCLEKSLEYDPHDPETYFMLMENSCDLNRRYTIVNRALKEFPDNIEVLFAGIEAAIGRGAFKKGSRLAADLLKIDPINKKARLLLVNAHLQHGRKLVGNGNLNLALKECDSAVTYDRAGIGLGEIEICHGLILLLADDRDNGLALHDQGVAKADNPLLGCFQASLEARLLQMPKKWLSFFDKNLRNACKTPPDNSTLLSLTTKIQHCNGKKHLYLQQFRKIITPWLKKGLKLQLSRDEYFSHCSVFHHRQYYDLLEIYGKKAHRLWPDSPSFTFYSLCGKCENGTKRLSMHRLDQLSETIYDAMEQHDPQTARLAEELLQKYYDNSRTSGREFDSMADGILGEFSDMMNSGEINQQDFVKFCEETSFLDELVDGIDDDAASGRDTNGDLPEKDANSQNKLNPKQLNLFE